MRIEVYKDDVKLDFENSLLIESFVKLNQTLEDYEPNKIDFSDVHFLLNEQNKSMLELAFQHQLKESLDGR